MATTREKYQRTHPSGVRCDRCGKRPRAIKTKTGTVTNPLNLMEGPSGKTFPKVCNLCRHILEGYGYKLYGPTS